MVIDITILISFLLFLIGEFGIVILDKIIYIGVIVLLIFEFTKTLNEFFDLNKTDLSIDLETLEKELEESKERTKYLETAIENIKTVIDKKDLEIVHESDELIIIKKIGKTSNKDIHTMVTNLLEPQVKI